MSPASKNTISPIVISEDNILIKLPFRLTFEYKGFNFLSPSIACSDFISWIAPIKELVKTTNKIIDGSIKNQISDMKKVF